MTPEFVAPHLQEVLGLVQGVKRVLSGTEATAYRQREIAAGSVILEEGDRNETIFIILDGTVQLSKVREHEIVEVDRLGPGDMVGLVSFWTGEPALVSVVAQTAVSTLCLSRAEFDRLSTTHPELNRLLQPLIIWNLAERYQRIVHLHSHVATLTRDLEKERNQLRDAYDRLEQASNLLVHREKMATLGELVAGIAHEINNPASALLRSIESLGEQLPGVLEREAGDRGVGVRHRLFLLGLTHSVVSTEEQRVRMAALSETYPHLPRTFVRTLSQLGDEGLALVRGALEDSARTGDTGPAEHLLRFFEVGTFIRSMQVSAERIGRLVKSLKSYSRQQSGQYEFVDLRQGIQDTLLIFGNRLRDVSVHLDLADIPKVRCQVGEINQVWTNIILNACDAMHERGVLKIACGREGDSSVWVRIADSGPGIPEELQARIFEPSYTTKTASGTFGLGLGLTIAREIVQKHGGHISVSNSPESGAVFTVVLPIAPAL